jgi:hypothetical protein
LDDSLSDEKARKAKQLSGHVVADIMRCITEQSGVVDSVPELYAMFLNEMKNN